MTQKLVIRLNEQSDDLEWLLQDSERPSSAEIKRASKSPIPELSPDVEIKVIVPAIQVFLTKAQLPKMPSTKLVKALPYAIEEELADDISQLHFAIGGRSSDQSLPVAVINHEQMQTWVTQVTDQIKTLPQSTAFFPESLTIPLHNQAWTLWIEGDRTIVRTGRASGFATDTVNLQSMLKASLDTASHTPEAFHVYANQQQTQWITEETNDLSIDIIVHQPDNLLSAYANYNGVAINLLQGEFQPKSRQVPTNTLWQLAGLLVVAWLALVTLSLTVRTLYFGSKSRALDQQVATVYKEIFPKAKSVVSPRKRVQRLLADARISEQSGAFLRMLDTIAPVVGRNSGLQVQEAIYSDQKLQLSVVINDFARLDKIVDRLKQLGLDVEQRGASKSGDKIRAQISLQEKP